MPQLLPCPVRIARTITACVAIVLAAGCRPRSSAPPPQRSSSPGPTQEVRDFYTQFGWNPDYANITGFNDEQKLVVAASGAGPQFGPLVRLYVSSRLDSLTKDDFEADTGALVAVANVWPNSGPAMPPEYTRLKFGSSTSRELYCVYLSHDRSKPVGDGWDGYVTYYDRSEKKCGSVDGQSRLPGVAVNTDNDNGNPGSFPPVARLTMNRSNQPGIGVACLAAWCELGYANSDYASPGNSSGHGPEWRIKGWQDEQVLSVPNGANTVKPWARGGVVPVANLESIHVGAYLSDWQRVGTIWLDDAPPVGSSYEKWHLQKGESDIWLKANRVLPDSVLYRAAFTSGGARPDGATPTFAVDRHGWPWRVPGVMRFVWASDDDLMWVSCDMGCCTVKDAM